MKIYHPLLALIASSLESELAQYVQYLKQENKILRARIPSQIHTTVPEREKLLKLGKPIRRAIEELMTIAKPATFHRWLRDAKNGKPPIKNRRVVKLTFFRISGFPGRSWQRVSVADIAT